LPFIFQVIVGGTAIKTTLAQIGALTDQDHLIFLVNQFLLAASAATARNCLICQRKKKKQMDITIDMINGLCFGLEFIAADFEEGFEQHSIVLDIACFRTILWIDAER
jgi:hypothetical protein